MSAVLKRGTFSKYDFGLMRNNEVYGTNVAPPYDVSNIPKDFHMFLAYGGSDTVADPNDVQRLIEMLPCNLEVAYLPSYSHFLSSFLCVLLENIQSISVAFFMVGPRPFSDWKREEKRNSFLFYAES
mgnify:FL=1